MSLNRWEGQGVLTRDPVVTELPSGAVLVEVTMAINDAGWDAEARAHVVQTIYVTLQLWDNLGGLMARGVRKGDEIFVVGRLDQKIVTKRDGTEDRKTRVVVLQFTLTRTHRVPAAASAPPPPGPARDPFA
jgi:single-stranded DNA-binding protein